MRSLWILALAALVVSGCITAPPEEGSTDDDETPEPVSVLRSNNDTLEQDVETQLLPTETDVGPGWTIILPDTVQTLDATLRWTQNTNDFRLRVTTPDGEATTHDSSGGSVTIDFPQPLGGTYVLVPRAMGAVVEDTLTLKLSYSWIEFEGLTEQPTVSGAITVRQEGNSWIAESVAQGRSTVDSTVEIELDVFNGEITLDSAGSEATVRMKVWARAASEARARELLQSLDTSVGMGQDAVSAIARIGSIQPGNNEGAGASLEASIPATVHGVIDSSNGAITLTDVKTSDLTATTSNGEISGSITASGPVTLDTSNGEVDVSFTPTKSLEFNVESSNGEINLALKEDTSIGYRLDAETSNGEVSESMDQASLDAEGEDEARLTTQNYSTRSIQVTGLIDTSNGSITFDGQ